MVKKKGASGQELKDIKTLLKKHPPEVVSDWFRVDLDFVKNQKPKRGRPRKNAEPD